MIMMNNYDYSSYFALSEQDATVLVDRLRVGMSIITFNAKRLSGYCYYLLSLHQRFRRKVLHKRNLGLQEPRVDSKQMGQILEFFLQMDGQS